MDKTAKKKSIFSRCLNSIEKTGNKLPHPMALFGILALAVVVVSGIGYAIDLSVTGNVYNSATGAVEMQTITVVNLFSLDGLVYMFTNAVKNFTSYAPLGTVLVAMLGIGVAESSGLIGSVLKQVVSVTPKQLITPVVVFLGIMSNVASDVGYVILIPIGALMFLAYDRHPMAGFAAAFAGVSGGFSANLLVGTLDPLLAGITNEAIAIVDPTYSIAATANLYFMMVSTLIITVVGTLITDKIVEPRLGAFDKNLVETDFDMHKLSTEEKSALKLAGISLVIFIAIVLIMIMPAGSPFRNVDGELVGEKTSPFINGIIIFITLSFFIPSIVYGFKCKKYKNEKDVCNDVSRAMGTMGGYIALSFVAAQFISYFNYSKLGTILAISGADLLGKSGLGPIPLMILMVLFSGFINLFMGSASAKWSILAPVFVPMFMLLGFSPELTQVAYRIGDSSTNIITPLMSYFAMIIVYAKKYDKEAGIGTIIATMIPYSIAFIISWTLLLVVWMTLGLDLGPGAGLFLN